jgi:hypothetical protein
MCLISGFVAHLRGFTVQRFPSTCLGIRRCQLSTAIAPDDRLGRSVGMTCNFNPAQTVDHHQPISARTVWTFWGKQKVRFVPWICWRSVLIAFSSRYSLGSEISSKSDGAGGRRRVRGEGNCEHCAGHLLLLKLRQVRPVLAREDLALPALANWSVPSDTACRRQRCRLSSRPARRTSCRS